MVYLHKSVFQSHGYLSHTVTCLTRLPASHGYLSHTGYLPHTVTCLTRLPASHGYLYHTVTCLTRLPVSHGYLYHTVTCLTRLPVQCKLSRGRSVGSQGLWVCAACVQKRSQQRRGCERIVRYVYPTVLKSLCIFEISDLTAHAHSSCVVI